MKNKAKTYTRTTKVTEATKAATAKRIAANAEEAFEATTAKLRAASKAWRKSASKAKLKAASKAKLKAAAKSLASVITLEDMVVAAHERGMQITIELVPNAIQRPSTINRMREAREVLRAIPEMVAEALALVDVDDEKLIRATEVKRLKDWLNLCASDLRQTTDFLDAWSLPHKLSVDADKDPEGEQGSFFAPS